jgi:DNA-binding MarR family transcriptional regulator
MTDPADPFEALRRNLTMTVRRTVVPRAHERILRRADVAIDRVEAIALSRIVDAGAMRVTELARQLGVTCSTAGRHAGRLEAEGLATRSTNPDDGRVTIITATEAGHHLVSVLRTAHRELLAEVLAHWERSDVETLARLLGDLAEVLDASTEPATVPA